MSYSTSGNITLSTYQVVRRADSGHGYEVSVSVESRSFFLRKKYTQQWVPFQTVDTLVSNPNIVQTAGRVDALVSRLATGLKFLAVPLLQTASDHVGFVKRAGYDVVPPGTNGSGVRTNKKTLARGSMSILYQQMAVLTGTLAGERGLVAAMPTIGALFGAHSAEARRQAAMYAALASTALIIDTAPELIANGQGTKIEIHSAAIYDSEKGAQHEVYLELTNVRTLDKRLLPIAYETRTLRTTNTVKVPWEPQTGVNYRHAGVANFQRI